MDSTLIFLVATSDFVTALDLAKVYPNIAKDRAVIVKFSNEYGLPDNGIATMEELKIVLIDNLFTDSVPTSLRLFYWKEKYFFVDAMRLAAAAYDTAFLDTYKKHFDEALQNEIDRIIYLLYDVRPFQKYKIHYASVAIKFLADHGYLEKIIPANLHKGHNKEVYIQQILRKEKWEMFRDVSKNGFEALKMKSYQKKYLNERIFDGLLSSGNLEYLKNPPEEVKSLKGWKVSKKYYIKISGNFPLNLPNSKFVRYFKKEILALGPEEINTTLAEGGTIESYNGFKTICSLFPKGAIVFDDDGEVSVGEYVTPRNETYILKLLRKDPKSEHMFVLNEFFADEILNDTHLRILELIRLHGPKRKIRKYLNQYLKDFYPDPILTKELEKLVK